MRILGLTKCRLLVVFLLCILTGIVVGTYIKKSIGDANAGSSNITVANNNQVITSDQGIPTITRTSTVTVKDTNAKYGYTLLAKLSNNSIPNATVKIGSSSSTTCTVASPCTLPVDNGSGTTTPLTILSTFGTISNPNTAITTQGHTSDWTVTVTMPTNTPIGNYMVDIEYAEELYTPPCPVLTGKTYMQDITNPTNSIYGNDTRVVLKDRRNSQDYYVQNIVNNDGTCTSWMETNLRYAGGGDNTYGDTKTLTLRSTGQGTNATAEYMNPGGSSTLNTATPTNNTTFYGYLYNWCAAMGGQANACNQTSTTGFDTTVSVCPAGWRLPTSDINGDFARLNQNVNAGSLTTDEGLADNWFGVYGGQYSDGLYQQALYGLYWSSSVYTAMDALYLGFESDQHVGTGNPLGKYAGFAVRCVKDTRPPKTLRDMFYLQDLALVGKSNVCANTPDRTRVVLEDRRNRQAYYIEKINGSGEGGTDRCWMESNLRYSGGGDWDASWGYPDDRRTLTLRSSGSATYTTAEYIDPGGSINYNTGGFYGYLYNWCAAMGGQANACSNTSSTGFDTTVSVCPAGWRLPKAGNGGDFYNLNNIVNGGSTTSSQGLFDNFLALYSGTYYSILSDQGYYAYYWSSSVAGVAFAYALSFGYNAVNTTTDFRQRNNGDAIRCML